MKLSTDRILTTHVGSLPRPRRPARVSGSARSRRSRSTRRLSRRVSPPRSRGRRQAGRRRDRQRLRRRAEQDLLHLLCPPPPCPASARCRAATLDRPPQTAAHRDIADHPDFAERLRQARGGTSWFAAPAVPCCIGPVTYRDRGPLETDLKNLAAACAAAKPVEAFMNAASPGVLTKFVPDRYYKNEDAYVEALAEALKQEYEAIHRAGFILQIDAPDLGSARHNQYQHLSRRRVPAHRRAQHRRAQPRNRATSRPRRCGCTSAGAITKGRTPTTSRSPRCSTPACGRGRRAAVRGSQPAPRP